MDKFRRNILKVDKPRKHSIKNSLGVYDGYKYIRKNKWFNIGQAITEHQFYYIIRTVNNYLIESILQGKDIKFPCKMGKLEVRKYDSFVRFNSNNKVETNLPVDWDKTLKLWSEDEEAYKKRALIKMEEKELFKIKYNKHRATYINKSFYEFLANRDLKRRLKYIIKEGNFDAFKL